jgi:hypothetical protein
MVTRRVISLAHMPSIATTPRHGRALHATAELLAKLRLDFAFVGGVARAAWIGGEVTGPIDVLALMTPQQKGQVAMMASNRGFRVDREEIEATEELDVVPLHFDDPEGEVRVHVLVASNALYGRMFAGVREADFDGRTIRVVAAEDLALLLTMADDEAAVRRLSSVADFDRHAYNERLASIGLAQMVIAE